MDNDPEQAAFVPPSPAPERAAPARPRSGPAEELERALQEAPEMPGMHWSVPWSDLMMTMFVLFAVLFIYASARRDFLEAFRGRAGVEAAQRETSPQGGRTSPMPVRDQPAPGALPTLGPQQVFETMNAAVRDAGLKDVTVRLEGDLVRITMHGPLLFDQFEAEVKPEGRRFLHAVAGILAKASNPVQIHGHTDSFPVSSARYPTNWELSAARAVNVARALMENEGLEPARVEVTGHSMHRPASPNLTSEARVRNRRVEIVIGKPEPAPEE